MKKPLPKKRIPTKKQLEAQKSKNRVVDAYLKAVESGIAFPTRADLAAAGISRDVLRHHFVNIKNLRESAKDKNPDLFSGVVSEEKLKSKKYLKDIEREVKSFKRFFITTAINGQPVDRDFYESVLNYCKLKNATLLIIPCHDPAHNLDNEVEWHFDDALVKHKILFSSMYLNSNIHISSIRITAKQINPHTGLSRFVQGKGSAIFGSPKQSLEYIPVSNVKHPHAMMSTGAITKANYSTTRGNSFRTAFIADFDHRVGGLIVEIQDDNYYHFRQVQADEKGCFVDLGTKYCQKKTEKMTGTHFVLGDYHAGQHDPSAVKAWKEVAEAANVDTILFHDLFNGVSINHHNFGKFLTRAKIARNNRLLLADEAKMTAEVLLDWKKYNRVIVKSNHDEFLEKWIESGEFKNDPYNFQLGCRIADRVLDGEDSLIALFKSTETLPKSEFDGITFLKRDEDYKFANIELGAHGDKGPNGSKGTIKSLERAYGKCVIAHTHSAGILRDVFQVGTTSLFDLEYNVGPSSWTHTSCLVYSNGQRQLINSINGFWTTK